MKNKLSTFEVVAFIIMDIIGILFIIGMLSIHVMR